MTQERIDEIAGEKLTSWADNGKSCIGCIFAEDAPDKGVCAIYKAPRVKPDNVYLDGDTCKYYTEAKNVE